MLPVAFGGITGVSLLFANAVTVQPVTATAEVRAPQFFVDVSEVDGGFSATLEDEAAIFGSDRITDAIAANFRGSLDPASATARPKPGTNSVLLIEVEGTSADEVAALADLAGSVFARERRAEQLDALTSQIDVASQKSHELRLEIDQLTLIDFAVHETDDVATAAVGETTPIAALIEPLAEEHAALDARIADYEQAVATIETGGHALSRQADRPATPPRVSAWALLALVGVAVGFGTGCAFVLGRREARDEPFDRITPPADFASNPQAWIDAFAGEPDGVFIDFAYDGPPPAPTLFDEIDLRSEPTMSGRAAELAAERFFSATPAETDF